MDGYPTILFIDPDGSVIGQIGGYEDPKPFVADLNKIAVGYRDLPILQAQVLRDPNDSAAKLKLAVMLLQRDRAAEAGSLVMSLSRTQPASKLAPYYEQLGDYYWGKHDALHANAWYQKFETGAQTPHDRAMAHMKTGVSYYMNSNKTAARVELQQVIDMADAPQELRAKAKEILAQIK